MRERLLQKIAQLNAEAGHLRGCIDCNNALIVQMDDVNAVHQETLYETVSEANAELFTLMNSLSHRGFMRYMRSRHAWK